MTNDLNHWLANASDDTRRLNADLFQKRPLGVENEMRDESIMRVGENAPDANLTSSSVEWTNDLVKITLFGERPFSLNDYYTGMHYMQRANEAKRIRETVQLALFNAGFAGKRPLNFRVCIAVYCFMVYPAYDTNNPSTKSYVDALQGFVIKKDDLRYVRAVLPLVVKVKENPRVEIIVGRLPWEEFLP